MLDGQLETYLVVALARAAVDDGVRAFFQGDLHKALGDAGTGMAGAQKIVLIDGAGLHAGDDVIVHILVRQIQDIELGRAGLLRLLLQALELVRLANVAGDRDDFAVVVVFLQPGDNDGGVQTAGICKNDFFDVRFIHNISSLLNIYAVIIGLIFKKVKCSFYIYADL